jgi:hypothetical protein
MAEGRLITCKTRGMYRSTVKGNTGHLMKGPMEPYDLATKIFELLYRKYPVRTERIFKPHLLQ